MEKINVTHKAVKVKTKVRLSEKQQIETGLKRWGRKAYAHALSNNGSVGVLRGNSICKVQAGSVDVVAKIPQTRYKITQRSFKLKK